jgi:hypothetical protein
MDQNEVNILRGFLTSVQQKRRRATGAPEGAASGAQEGAAAVAPEGAASGAHEK